MIYFDIFKKMLNDHCALAHFFNSYNHDNDMENKMEKFKNSYRQYELHLKKNNITVLFCTKFITMFSYL